MNGYKMQTTYILVVLAVFLQQTFAGTFPEFIEKCKVSDPNIDDCILKSANAMLPIVINGDDKYGIPPLFPPNMTKIYNITSFFGMKFTNLSVHTNEDPVITDIRIDFERKILSFNAKCRQIQLSGDYTTVGRCPGNLESESGKVDMTFDDVKLRSVVPLDFKMQDDKKYLVATSCSLNIQGKNFQFKPYEQARTQIQVGVMMTDEEKQMYHAYIHTIPILMQIEIKHLNKEAVEALNKIFDLLPFEEMFLP